MSPIELQLLKALRAAVPDTWTMFDETQQTGTEEEPNCVEIGTGETYADLRADVPIGTYRADFVIHTDTHVKLAIECDGHDYHDRTKQQAAYDRARDRELLILGIPTIRFTGSEIFHSPERCAAEVYAVVRKLLEQAEQLDLAWEAGRQRGHQEAIGVVLKARRTKTIGIMSGVV